MICTACDKQAVILSFYTFNHNYLSSVGVPFESILSCELLAILAKIYHIVRLV